MESYCVRAFAEALEVIPYTLAENAGLNPIQIVTELRNKHASGMKAAGINVRRSAGLGLWGLGIGIQLRPPPCHVLRLGCCLRSAGLSASSAFVLVGVSMDACRTVDMI